MSRKRRTGGWPKTKERFRIWVAPKRPGSLYYRNRKGKKFYHGLPVLPGEGRGYVRPIKTKRIRGRTYYSPSNYDYGMEHTAYRDAARARKHGLYARVEKIPRSRMRKGSR